MRTIIIIIFLLTFTANTPPKNGILGEDIKYVKNKGYEKVDTGFENPRIYYKKINNIKAKRLYIVNNKVYKLHVIIEVDTINTKVYHPKENKYYKEKYYKHKTFVFTNK